MAPNMVIILNNAQGLLGAANLHLMGPMVNLPFLMQLSLAV
uniref:Uncharacterized protein n=1 Tax=Rheinheimera sp. BAL341 TaxID=1708203 RepID=A0A486XKB0_9GAMM